MARHLCIKVEIGETQQTVVFQRFAQLRRIGTDLIKKGAQSRLTSFGFDHGKEFMHRQSAAIAGAVGGQIGAVGAFILGIVMLGETVSPMRLLAAALIVSGLVLMKAASPS